MKAYAITLKNNKVSENGTANLIKSSKAVGNDFEILHYDAITPEESLGQLALLNLVWNYPWDKPVRDIATGLLKTPYPTKNRDARIACALSHYHLWLKCYKENEIILVLEHDAIWKKKLPNWVTEDSRYDIIGINDPYGATRLSKKFHEEIQKKESLIQRPPVIDEEYIPQGIAGNSAYIMKPSGAKKMLDLVAEYGLWPNDAIMCRQLVRTLGVTKNYYTGVQGLPSTTSS